MEDQHRTFARESIKRHEGFREQAYFDTEGILTIGYGTNLVALAESDPDMLLQIARQKFRVTDAQATDLMHGHFEQAIKDAERFAGDAWNEMTERQRAALIDMAYNLGATRLGKFDETQEHLQRLEFDDVAEHLLRCKAARQTGDRYKNLAKWMQEG